MDKLIFFGFGFIGLAAIVYFLMRGKDEGDEEIAKHLPKSPKKSSQGTKKPIDLNNGADSAKSGNLLDTVTSTSTVPKSNTLAKWVDSEEYDEPEKLVTAGSFAKIQGKMKGDGDLVNNTNKPVVEEVKPIILLVDDSLTVRTLLGKLLGKSGQYQVILKENGLDAVNYLDSGIQKPDLIITDMQMPEMDGFELIEEVRKRHRFDSIPMIAISSVFEPEDHLELLELEKIQGFIKKQNPFDENDLLQQITYLMNNFY